MKRVPRLTPCPDCGVPLQVGTGPHRLAHHGCFPPASAEDLEAAIRKRLLKQIYSGEISVVEAAKALRAMSGPGPGRPAKAKREDPDVETTDEEDGARVLRMLKAPAWKAG